VKVGSVSASKGLSSEGKPMRGDSLAMQFYNKYLKKEDLDEGIENIVDADNVDEFSPNDINSINVSFQKM
jgi:hypothetical protein